jgi:hypothetical protein
LTWIGREDIFRAFESRPRLLAQQEVPNLSRIPRALS